MSGWIAYGLGSLNVQFIVEPFVVMGVVRPQRSGFIILQDGRLDELVIPPSRIGELSHFGLSMVLDLVSANVLFDVMVYFAVPEYCPANDDGNFQSFAHAFAFPV